MKRSSRWWLCVALVTAAARLDAAEPALVPLLVFTDIDDDDDDGEPDLSAEKLDGELGRGVRWLTGSELPPARGTPRILSPVARWVADGRPLAEGAALPRSAQRVGIQGLRPGRVGVVVGAGGFELSVLEVAAYDARGARIDLARSHASISRVLPAFLSEDVGGLADEDALRWSVRGPAEALPERLELGSLRADGSELDRLAHVELRPEPCPPDTPAELACRTSPPIRGSVDPIDSSHPESRGRSLRAEVGGRLVVRVHGRDVASVRVGGPRTTALGPIERYRARLRVHVVRASPGGSPAIGKDATEAVSLARAEIDAASFIWGQCGIHFGRAEDTWVELVDPPPSHLIAVGCELGLPASGGELRFRIGKRAFRLSTAFGDTPARVASRLEALLRGAGFSVEPSEVPRTESGALPTADLSVRLGAQPVAVEPDGEAPLSSDPSLDLCLGSVELADGLRHFVDHNAPAGTLEERTLLKAYADRDPRTLEVFIVPSFASEGRVGESFLDDVPSAIQNTVIIDRLAVRAGARSHVLAHELGHVLLDMPGHPDDYGVDQPSALMDADATDPSIFGPRRLSIAECERALRQRGPAARAPLLEAWPLVRRR